MDLADLDIVSMADVGADMVLKNPKTDYKTAVIGNDEKPVTFKVTGLQSKALRDFVRNLDRSVAMGASISNEERGVLTILHIVKGWSDNLVFDGKPLAYNEINARMLFTRFEWIANQVLEFAMLPSGFFPKQPTD